MSKETPIFEAIKKQVEEEVEEKSRMIASEILHDGTIIEMLYNQKERVTSLSIYQDGKVTSRKTFDYEGITLKPHPATKDRGKSLFPILFRNRSPLRLVSTSKFPTSF